MVGSANARTGRVPFDLARPQRDYSGLTITDTFLIRGNIEKSFFNGANLTNCVFAQVRLNNTEFTQAEIRESEFRRSNLSGCDFVACLVEHCVFANCNFQKGEWRDTRFNRCLFINCNFDHTTVTLCTFMGCKVDESTMASAEHRAVYFNTFSQCDFAQPTGDNNFSGRNFGVPTAVSSSTYLTPDLRELTIEHVCLLNNIGKLRVIELVSAVENLCSLLQQGPHRLNSTLAFSSRIIRIMTEERRISATSLTYLEGTISHLASIVDDQDLFTTAMAAIVEIRSALFAIVSEESAAASDVTDGFLSITIVFSETYPHRQVHIFSNTLAEVSGIPASELPIKSIREGSTIIELASGAVVSTGGLLLALNFVLRQARVTIERLADLKRAVKKLRQAGTQVARPRAQRRVPSIMKTGPVSPELTPVRNAVRRYGKALVEMDEPAEVRISVE